MRCWKLIRRLYFPSLRCCWAQLTFAAEDQPRNHRDRAERAGGVVPHHASGSEDRLACGNAPGIDHNSCGILAPNEAVVAMSMEVRIGDNAGMLNIDTPSIVVKMLRHKFDQQWSGGSEPQRQAEVSRARGHDRQKAGVRDRGVIYGWLTFLVFCLSFLVHRCHAYF